MTTLVATAPTSAFDQFISRRHAVAAAYSNGDAAALDAIVAREGEATFFPPNGGCVSGVDEVSTRYDRDAKSFSRGSKTKLDIFQSSASGELAFWTGFLSAARRSGENRGARQSAHATPSGPALGC